MQAFCTRAVVSCFRTAFLLPRAPLSVAFCCFCVPLTHYSPISLPLYDVSIFVTINLTDFMRFDNTVHVCCLLIQAVVRNSEYMS